MVGDFSVTNPMSANSFKCDKLNDSMGTHSDTRANEFGHSTVTNSMSTHSIVLSETRGSIIDLVQQNNAFKSRLNGSSKCHELMANRTVLFKSVLKPRGQSPLTTKLIRRFIEGATKSRGARMDEIWH